MLRKILNKKFISLVVIALTFSGIFLLSKEALLLYNNDLIGQDERIFTIQNSNNQIRINAKKENLQNPIKEKIYDLIDDKPKKTVKSYKIKEEIKNKNLKTKDFSKQKTQNKPGKIINYKNHNIHITANKNKKAKKNNYKNMVQLGAFTSIKQANDAKRKISKLFPNKTKRFDFHIEKKKIKNKGLIYRLKFGSFKNTVKANNACNSFRKKGIDCFITIK